MIENTNDLGAALFKTWPEKQRSDEIEKLVQGFRNGIPVGILCKMSETVAGSQKNARKYLRKFMSADERKSAIESAPEAVSAIAKSLLA